LEIIIYCPREVRFFLPAIFTPKNNFRKGLSKIR